MGSAVSQGRMSACTFLAVLGTILCASRPRRVCAGASGQGTASVHVLAKPIHVLFFGAWVVGGQHLTPEEHCIFKPNRSQVVAYGRAKGWLSADDLASGP